MGIFRKDVVPIRPIETPIRLTALLHLPAVTPMLDQGADDDLIPSPELRQHAVARDGDPSKNKKPPPDRDLTGCTKIISFPYTRSGRGPLSSKFGLNHPQTAGIHGVIAKWPLSVKLRGPGHPGLRERTKKESDHGTVCWLGRVIERDIDLRG